ncbi:MAG: His/Gly/Thr/Pro-type tRNA ligase C-terminal domain-containing protein, partial [Haemophilus parainfluenzae]|nr:His/Gly/Thr/Pro-type tRNA ligase C-terminal domain-containing protein [Haemophilus parainfluenzae]
FKRADKSGATLALVLGESEVQNNQVVVKHLLGAAEQQTIDVANLIEHVKAQF